jgi:hypothetical protein
MKMKISRRHRYLTRVAQATAEKVQLCVEDV